MSFVKELKEQFLRHNPKVMQADELTKYKMYASYLESLIAITQKELEKIDTDLKGLK